MEDDVNGNLTSSYNFYRGGVLEPAGTVEIKFRRKDLVKAIHRLDTKCQEIIKALASAGNQHAFTQSRIFVDHCNACPLKFVNKKANITESLSTRRF